MHWDLADGEMITSLEEFLGKMQRGVCCGVCTELLYQPFNLSCGHVFCYSVPCLVGGADRSVLSTGLSRRSSVQHVENECWKNPLSPTS